jgi:DNA polymerase III delta subunit
MVLSWQQALKELNSGKQPPHKILLHGDDQYMRSAVIAGLTRSLQRNGEIHIARQDPPFKADENEGEESDDKEPAVKKTELSPDIESALSSGSLFSSIELVILPTTFYPKVAQLLANAPDTVTVVFCSSRKISSTQKVFKAADWTVECIGLKWKNLESWMVAEARQLGHNLPKDAADHLSFISGNNMGIIANELQKFSTYLGSKGTITLDLVENLGSHTSGKSIFDLSDAVVSGNGTDLRKTLTDLLEQDQSPFYLLVMVSKYLLQLLELTLFKKEGKVSNPYDVTSLLGIHPFPAQKLWSQAPRWTPDRVEKALWVMLNADLDMKTGKGSPELLLEAALAEAALAARG